MTEMLPAMKHEQEPKLTLHRILLIHITAAGRWEEFQVPHEKRFLGVAGQHTTLPTNTQRGNNTATVIPGS